MSAIKNFIDEYAHDNEMTFQQAMEDPHCLPTSKLNVAVNTVTMKFSHSGDSSVGVSGDSATVTLDVSMFDSEDAKLYVDKMKSELSETFREAWEFPVQVEMLNLVEF